MKTGAVAWDVTLEDYKIGYASTIAPLIVKDKVIVGVAGGEFGIRGFIDAYEANTGKRAGDRPSVSTTRPSSERA